MINPEYEMRNPKETPTLDSGSAPTPSGARCWLGWSLLLLSIHLSANAQTYAINWWTIAGGGGTSTGGVYQVRGSLGQFDVGVMTNGIYALKGGFWGGVAAVQTTGAPYLSVTNFNSNVVISWPIPDSDWKLEFTTQLGTTDIPVWTLISPPYSTNNGDCMVTEPASLENKFYRLRKP